ncbi:MAG: exodeoxyribonuclease VII small subunit [Methylobacteriaceae bacterium]|nr:exodeoxyribonuclease VII small subunit [Methylobacteriaceae bacterium]
MSVPTPVAKLNFEDAMKELDAIVSRLEKGEAALEESITLYERGAALKERCETLLKTAEARIERIRQGADGKPAGVVPLDGG